MRIHVSAAIMFCLSAAFADALGGETFPFAVPGDDARHTITDMSGLSPWPAGAEGFVRIRNGHFHTDGGRLRIWGVNGVRVHHHDSSNAPRGIWGGYDGTRRVFSLEAIDRQDYLLDQLHRHGIYVNLNLHVSRTLWYEFVSE